MESKCRWRVIASGALMLSMLALTVEGQQITRRAVPLDGNEVTHVYVAPGGATAEGGASVAADFYAAAGSGYISGCWGHGTGIAWADEMRFANVPITGGAVDWYSFNYAMGYGYLFGYCVPGDPAAGDCDCYCPTGGACDEGDPPYNMDIALYDGPPGACGAGLPIAGTEVAYSSTNSRPLGYRSITLTIDVDPKVLVPSVVWGVVMTDQEDAFLAIGSAPHVGTSTQDGAMWTDADSDGVWETWECWPDPYGWSCPGCTGWMVWSAAGNADVIFSMVPVPPPAGTKHPGTYTIEKNGLTLDKGDEVVFFEIRVSEFDPTGAGTLLKAWQAGLDAVAGYSSGLQGTLAPHFADCTTDAGVCAVQMGPGSTCPFPPTNCPAGFINSARDDYIFKGQMELSAVDVSTLNYRYASTLMGAPIAQPVPHRPYLGTLVLYVPADAKGTFTIPFLTAPDTALVDSNNQFIPLIGFEPGQVTVTTGRCCFGLGADDKKAGCIEDVTANQCVNAGLCKGFCDLNPGILCLSDYDCEQQGAPGSICVAGATLGGACFTVLEKPDGKPLGCDGPDICVVQGTSVLLTDGLTCDDPCCECTQDADCDDGVACTNDSCGPDCMCVFAANDTKCDDGNPCTDDWCDPLADCQFDPDDTNACDDDTLCRAVCVAGGCVEDDCDDMLACTTDSCDPVADVCSNDKIDCADADPCTVDYCAEPGGGCMNVLLPPLPDPACPIVAGSLDECLAATVDQYTGMPIATAWDAASGCCLCVLCSNHTACDDFGAIIPACRADIYYEISESGAPNGMCFGQGEKIVVDVLAGESLQPIYGAQFIATYDPACVTFNSITPSADFPFEIEEIVDAANGRVFYAVGVDPFGGVGTFGPVVLAHMSFTKIGHGCTNCTFNFADEKPMHTFFVNDEGQLICADQVKSPEIHQQDRLTLDVPEDQKVNVDCDAATAMVYFDVPTASSSCYDPDCDPMKGDKCYEADLECYGMHESGKDMTAVLYAGGGEHPQGMTTYTCVATSNICGKSAIDEWTVTVNDTVALDVEVQLQPKIDGDLVRCINFELFADCVKKPLTLQTELVFGGVWDFVGHFTDEMKIPKGQYECITARDQQHTLRATSDMVCIDGVYQAAFKGDPFFGGNWLVGGNIDTWKKEGENISIDTIDILDFGVFVWRYGEIVNPNTLCAEKHDFPHADINGDGIVDGLDFTFIMMNFLQGSKDACCPDKDGHTAGPVALDEISVSQLRQMGLGELVVADLNGDGLVNVADMSAFMNGQEPNKKNVRVRDDSGLGSR